MDENNHNDLNEFYNNLQNYCTLNCRNFTKIKNMNNLISELNDEIESLKFVNSSLLKSLRLKEDYISFIIKQKNIRLCKDNNSQINFNKNNINNIQQNSFKSPNKSSINNFTKPINKFSLTTGLLDNNNIYHNRNLENPEINIKQTFTNTISKTTTNKLNRNKFNFNKGLKECIDCTKTQDNSYSNLYISKNINRLKDLEIKSDDENNNTEKHNNMNLSSAKKTVSEKKKVSKNLVPFNNHSSFFNFKENESRLDEDKKKKNFNKISDKDDFILTEDSSNKEKLRGKNIIDVNNSTNKTIKIKSPICNSDKKENDNYSSSFNKTGFIYRLVNMALEKKKEISRENEINSIININNKSQNSSNNCSDKTINKLSIMNNPNILIKENINKDRIDKDKSTKEKEELNNNKINENSNMTSFIEENKNEYIPNNIPLGRKKKEFPNFFSSLKIKNTKNSEAYLGNEYIINLNENSKKTTDFEVIEEKEENKSIKYQKFKNTNDEKLEDDDKSSYKDYDDIEQNEFDNDDEKESSYNQGYDNPINKNINTKLRKRSIIVRANSFKEIKLQQQGLQQQQHLQQQNQQPIQNSIVSPSPKKSNKTINNLIVNNNLLHMNNNNNLISKNEIERSNSKKKSIIINTNNNINLLNQINLQNIFNQINSNSSILNINGVFYTKINSNLTSILNDSSTTTLNPKMNLLHQKYVTNENSHYNKILGLFNRIQKSSSTSTNRVSFLGYSDSILKKMVKSDLINEICKLTNSEKEFIICMRAFKEDKLILFCDLISSLVKDYQYSMQLIRKIKTFLTNSVKLVNSTNSNDALKIIINNCNEVLNSESTVIYLYDKYSKKLLMKDIEKNLNVGGHNIDFVLNTSDENFVKKNKNRKNIIKPGEGVVGWVFQNNQKQKIDDLKIDNRFYEDDNENIDNESLNENKNSKKPIKTILCYPLRDEDGNPYGVIESINKKKGYFTNDDEELIDIFSKQISSILENSLQHNEYNTQISRLQTVLDFSLQIPFIQDFCEFCKVCENSISNLWGVNEARLFYIDKTDESEEIIKYDNGETKKKFKPIGLIGKCYFRREIISVINIYENQDYNSLIDIEECLCLVTFPIFDYSSSKDIQIIMQLEFNSDLLYSGRLKKSHIYIFNNFCSQVAFWYRKVNKLCKI